ncbi:phage antirepressor [Nocardia sp. NPDC003963]
MSALLMPFTYADTTVRTVVIDGEPWFVLADLCQVLGLTTPARVAERIDPAAVSQTHISSGGQQRAVSIVSEPGMYEVVIRSDKPEAVAFRRWITSEVLPTIRKTGGAYIAPGSQAELDLTNPDTALDKLIEVAQVAKAERAKRMELEAKVEADAPKVEAYEQFMEADGTYLVGTVARMLGTSQNKLFAELRNRGVFIPKGSMKNTPYQRFMQHFTVKATHFERSDGSEGVSYTTRVKPSGVDFIRRRLNMQVVAS